VLEDTTTAKATLGDRYVRNTGTGSDVLNNCTVSDFFATVVYGVEQASKAIRSELRPHLFWR
jgi:hypothetical protein